MHVTRPGNWRAEESSGEGGLSSARRADAELLYQLVESAVRTGLIGKEV
jgi:hypothetical protein